MFIFRLSKFINSFINLELFGRRDLQLALLSARKTQAFIVPNSIVYFTSDTPEDQSADPCPLRLRKIIDLVSAVSIFSYDCNS